MHCDVFADVLASNDLLVENGGGASLELVIPHLLLALVGGDVVSQQRRLLGGNDTDVNVGTRTQIVPDTSLDGVGTELDGFVLVETRLPLGLEDRHGGQRTRTHSDVGELVGTAVGVDGEEMAACGVAAGYDQVGANVTLVAEQMLLEHGHDGGDTGLASGG